MPQEVDEITGQEAEDILTEQEKEKVENLELEEKEEELKTKSSEGEDEVEKGLEGIEGVPFKDIKAKYPDLFKDFPQLRHTFFHEKEYRELYPTVEDAKEAAEDANSYRGLQEAFNGGAPGLAQILQSFDDESFTEFVGNILPTLREVNSNAYYAAISPQLAQFTQSLYQTGVHGDNENLKNAGLLAAQYFFGDEKVASGERQVEGAVPKKRDNSVERERAEFHNEKYVTFHNDVASECNTQLMASIVDGIDPRGVMSKDMKELLAEKVIKEINNSLSSSKYHMGIMNSLWQKASQNGFPGTSKSRITSTYLTRAKEVMPGIRSKIRAAALGLRKKESKEEPNGIKGRVEPRSNVGGRSNQNTSNRKNVDASKIDWSKTTDLDYINGRITYKE